MQQKTITTSKIAQGDSLGTLVVGAGLAGLAASALFLKQGKQVVLSELLPAVGGRLSPEARDGFQLGAGFSFGDAAAYRALGDRLGLNLKTVPVENGGALLHTTKGWVPAADLPDWEAYFARPTTEMPEGGLSGVVKQLLEYCEASPNFRLALESPVTSLEAENGKVTRAVLGSETSVGVEEVIWTAPYRTLLETLGMGFPAPGPERVSFLKRFVKGVASPGVVLEYAHSRELSDFTETLVLPFNVQEKEERRYLVGAFTSNRDPGLAPNGKALSTWILPLTEAEWGDNHETMKKIRAGKRLLDKAFNGFEAAHAFERVVVLESTATPLAKQKGEWRELLPNFKIVSDWTSPSGAHAEGMLEVLFEHL